MKSKRTDKLRMMAMIVVSLFVIATGTFFSLKAFMGGDIGGGILGGMIAIIILIFAIFVFTRGNRDLKNGFPLKDERSIRVLEKASSKAFYVSIYLLLAVGFLSEGVIKFRDVSQATSIAVAGMAVLFGVNEQQKKVILHDNFYGNNYEIPFFDLVESQENSKERYNGSLGRRRSYCCSSRSQMICGREAVQNAGMDACTFFSRLAPQVLNLTGLSRAG